MTRTSISAGSLAIILAVALAACGKPAEDTSMPAADAAATAGVAAAIPASLAPFGDGWPKAGDPCRRLGESPATANWLDDSAVLVGCPTAEAAAALGGKVLATVEGVTVVTVPTADANAGMPAADGDAKVAGTDYNATAELPCAVDGGDTRLRCKAGVKRKWGEDGTTLVEVTKPDGRMRALFFKGTEATGADSAQADGSAAYDFKAERMGDETRISFGPERYVVPDAFVVGG
jgi:hypothetical protein